MQNKVITGRKGKNVRWGLAASVAVMMVVGLLTVSPSLAAVQVFSKNLAGFDAAAGSPPITINFDNFAPGTDITDTTISGVLLQGPGAPLEVVKASDTFTNFWGNPPQCKLVATTGENVLSPGGIVLGPGPNNAVENDDLTLIFSLPVSAFGFDHLSQSSDGASYTQIAVYDPGNVVLYSGTVPISALAGGAGGADFWGIVSDSANIAKIVINEDDNNATNPDCNIGFDTFRFHPVPLPGTVVLLGSGLLSLAGLARFRRK